MRAAFVASTDRIPADPIELVFWAAETLAADLDSLSRTAHFSDGDRELLSVPAGARRVRAPVMRWVVGRRLFLDGFTQEEVADHLRISRQTVARVALDVEELLSRYWRRRVAAPKRSVG